MLGVLDTGPIQGRGPFVNFLPDLEFRKHSWGVGNSEERVGEPWQSAHHDSAV